MTKEFICTEKCEYSRIWGIICLIMAKAYGMQQYADKFDDVIGAIIGTN